MAKSLGLPQAKFVHLPETKAQIAGFKEETFFFSKHMSIIDSIVYERIMLKRAKVFTYLLGVF